MWASPRGSGTNLFRPNHRHSAQLAVRPRSLCTLQSLMEATAAQLSLQSGGRSKHRSKLDQIPPIHLMVHRRVH